MNKIRNKAIPRNMKLWTKVVSFRNRGLTFQKIGDVLNLSKQRVNQIYHKAMNNKQIIMKSNRRSSLNTGSGKVITDSDILRSVRSSDYQKQVPLIDKLENGENGIFKPVRRKYE